MHLYESRGRAQGKFRELQRLVRDHFVVFLQETHGELGDLDTLRRVFPDCRAVASFGPHPGVGGVAIIYKKYLEKEYSVGEPVVIEQGRVIILKLTGASGYVFIANVHINPNHPTNTKIAVIADLLQHLPRSLDSLVVLGGDFNFESRDGYRMDFVHGREVVSYSPEGEYFYDHACDFIEITQPNYTRIGFEVQESGAKVAVSGGVLDHFYVFTDPMQLMYHKPHTQTLHNIYHPDRLSDHSAISLHLNLNTHPLPDTPSTIPPWVFKHPFFLEPSTNRLHKLNLPTVHIQI